MFISHLRVQVKIDILHGDLSAQKGGHSRQPGRHRANLRRGRQTGSGLPSGHHQPSTRVRSEPDNEFQQINQRSQAEHPVASTEIQQVSV